MGSRVRWRMRFQDRSHAFCSRWRTRFGLHSQSNMYTRLYVAHLLHRFSTDILMYTHTHRQAYLHVSRHIYIHENRHVHMTLYRELGTQICQICPSPTKRGAAQQPRIKSRVNSIESKEIKDTGSVSADKIYVPAGPCGINSAFNSSMEVATNRSTNRKKIT